MKVINTEIPEVKIIEPQVRKDPRGYFFESFNQLAFENQIGPVKFVQDNQSFSVRNTFRGLHYQLPPFAQAKLVRVTQGAVLDFAVDIRKGSPTFGRSVAVELTDSNYRQLFVPRGFAHGFLVLSETAIFQYKVDNYYSTESDRGIRFDDPQIALHFPNTAELLLSAKDQALPLLETAELFDFSAPSPTLS
jgi:dTDP-4-dehydrorhamnose 3,5-epimerase